MTGSEYVKIEVLKSSASTWTVPKGRHLDPAKLNLIPKSCLKRRNLIRPKKKLSWDLYSRTMLRDLTLR